jgi:phenylalanine-4-hydroxylase
VIASDIRQLEHIEYTPAPDIIHESAGHAPIIANPDYAEYLRRLGAIGAKAILSKHDMDLYEAVRKLSILKEAEGSTPEEIKAAEATVDQLQDKKVELSEMAKIRNLQWWTVEYGLVGSMDDPKIYGAGLLSSIGESKSCLSDKVRKIPYSIDAAYQEFDITRPQPQLYVTPDFSYLMQVLETFSNTLSVRKGGSKGLQNLIDSRMVGTIELSTGLQISGKFSRAIVDEDKEVVFFQTEGPTALAYREKELIGHGTADHLNGFGSPLGKLKNINLAIEDMGPVDLKAYDFYDGKWLSFEFESGVKVEGLNITGIRNIQGKLMLIQLEDCIVSYQEEILFRPADGVFNMVVGKAIVSAYAGAADYRSFPNLYEVSPTLTVKQSKSEATQRREDYYATIRELGQKGSEYEEALADLYHQLSLEYPDEWLLYLEIFELAKSKELEDKVLEHLKGLVIRRPGLKQLVWEGIALMGKAIAV